MNKLDNLILEAYKEVLNEMPKGAQLKVKDLPKAMIDRLEKQYGPVDPKRDFFSKNMDTYFKFTNRNATTGSIEHKIIKLPSFFKMYDDFQNIVDDIKSLMRSDDIRKDSAARELFELIKTNFRKLQTYLRTERPEQYSIIRQRVTLEGLVRDFKVHCSLIAEEKGLIEERKNEFAPGGKYFLPDDGYMAAKLRADDGYFNPRGATETDASGDTPEDDAEFAIKNNMGVKDPEKIKKFIDGWMKYNQEVLDGTTKYVEPKPDPNRFFQKRRRSNPGKNPRYGKKTNALIQKLKAKRGVNEGYADYEPGTIAPEDLYYSDKHGKLVAMDDVDDKYHDRLELVYRKGDKIEGPMDESLLDQVNEQEPQPEEPGEEKGAVLEDATDKILGKFPTLRTAIIKLQTEDFKEFVESIDWISPRPTSFRINLKNGQDYILKWTGKTFEAQILGKRYLLSNIAEYQQALDKLAILYKEAPFSGAGEGEPVDTDTGGGGGGGGDFPGGDAAGGGGEEGGDEVDALGGEEGGEEGGADLGGEPIDFEEPGEEPEA